MAFDAHANFATGLVATAPAPADTGTSLDVQVGQGALFPAVPFNATVWDGTSLPLATNAEIVRVTGIAGDTLTITRQAESSTARSILVGDRITATITKKTLTDIETAFAGTGFTTTSIAGAVVAGTHDSAGLKIAVPAYLTTAGLSGDSTKYAGIGETVGTIAGSDLGLTVNTDGVSIGYPKWLTTAMASNAATLSNVRVSAGTTSNLLSAVTFADGHGVSFGLDAGTITASVAAAGGAQTGISGIVVSDTTYTSGTVSFSNAGNITISSSVNGATQYIQLSGNAAQTNQSAIKAFGISNTGNTAGNTGISSGIDWVIAASGGVTASQSTAAGGPNTAWISVANVVAQTNQTAGWYALGNTTQNSSTTLDARTFSLNGLGAMTVGYSNGSIQLSVTAPPIGTAVKAVASVGSTGTITRFAPEDHQHAGVAAFAVTNTGNTAGNTRSQVGTLFIAASGGITASQSTAAAGNDTVWLSVANPVAQTNQTVGLYALGNTTQNSSTTLDARTLSFNGLGMITMGYSNGSIQVSATQSNQTGNIYGVSNTTGASSSSSYDMRSLSIQGAGVASVGWTNGSLIVSVPSGGGAGYSAGMSTGGNTSGDTGLVTGRLALAGGNNITLSGSTNAGSMTITISAGAGGYGGGQNWYAVGNTTQSSSSALNTSAISLNALGGLTAGFSNGSVQLSSPVTTALYAGNNISISNSSNSLTINAQLLTLDAYEPWRLGISTTRTIVNSFMMINPFVLPAHVTCDAIMVPFRWTASSTSSVPVTNSTATTGSSASVSAGMSLNLFLFTRGSGGYSTNLYSWYTTQATFSTSGSWSQTASNTTTGTQTMGSSVGYTFGYPAITSGTMTSVNAGSTVTTWGTSTASSTATVTSSVGTWPQISLWTHPASGGKLVYMNFATLMTPGLQWLGIQRMSATGGAANIAHNVSIQGSTGWETHGMSGGWMPFGQSAASLQAQGIQFGGAGFFSTSYATSVSTYAGSGLSSAAMALSQILEETSGTTVTIFTPYVRFANKFPF